MLKPREATVVWTRVTNNRLVLEERRERAGAVVAKKRAEVSWLRGVESVMSQCAKFEIDAMVDW